MGHHALLVLLAAVGSTAVGAVHAAAPHRPPGLPPLARYLHTRHVGPLRRDVAAALTAVRTAFDGGDDAAPAPLACHDAAFPRGGEAPEGKKFCGQLLAGAYTAAGLATTAAWATVVRTTIRSNQPTGAMMPSWQHQFSARMCSLSAVPLIGAAYYTLAKAASTADSWDDLATPSARRHNLALAAAGVGSALWTGFAPLLTKIPGTDPLQSHQAYDGLTRAGLVGGYAAGAALAGLVWTRSLPAGERNNPLAWPGRIADGAWSSLCRLAPASADDPVHVKYAALCASMLVFTGLQLGSHPLSVVPSWTGRRLARAFPAWTLLGAATAFDLKAAAEGGTLLDDPTARALSAGVKGFGATYLGSKAFAVLCDPSWPHSYHAVVMVPGWATAAVLMIGVALRSDHKEAKYYVK